MVSVPDLQDERNDNTYSQTDGEEHSVRGEADQYSDHDYRGKDQAGRAFHVDRHAWQHGQLVKL